MPWSKPDAAYFLAASSYHAVSATGCYEEVNNIRLGKDRLG